MGSGLTLRSLKLPSWDPIAPNPAGLSFVLGDPDRTSLVLLSLRACLDLGLPTTERTTQVKLVLSNPAGLNVSVSLERDRYELDCAGTVTRFGLKNEVLSGLEKALGINDLRCPLMSQLEPLQLTADLLALFATVSEEQRWRLLQDSESRRVAFLQRREDLESKIEAAREELLNLQQSRHGEGLDKVRERIRDTETELLECTDSLQRIESTWKRWQEHQSLGTLLKESKKTLEVVRQRVVRLGELEEQLGGRFLHAPGPDQLRQDLSLLEVSRNDRRHAKDQFKENRTKATHIGEQLETGHKSLEETHGQYKDISSEFPVYLHLYKSCESYRQAAEDESASLTEQLKANAAELERFPQFENAPEDFQAQVGALVAGEQEVAQQRPALEEKLAALEAVHEQRERLVQAIGHEYDDYPDDWEERLGRLNAVRQEAEAIRGQAEDVDERRAMLEDARPSFLVLTDDWPADFPDQLRRLRVHQSAMLEEDARDCEKAELEAVEVDIVRQLKGYDGLEEQSDLPMRLQDLLQKRQELDAEVVARDEMEGRIRELRKIVGDSRPVYAEFGDKYPAQVEQLRLRVSDRNLVAQRLESARQQQKARQELETQLAAYPELAGAVDAFPEQLREYFRLQQVQADLVARVQPMEDQLETLRTTVAVRHPLVETVSKSVLEGLRTEDDTLFRLIKHLESELTRRRVVESRLDTLMVLLATEVPGAVKLYRELTGLSDAPQAAIDELIRHIQENVPNLEQAVRSAQEREALQVESIQLTAQLDAMPADTELAAMRDNLLQMVAARLERFGIELVVEDYLSYQSTQADINRLESERDRILRRSGSGDDLSRIQDKLQQLTEALGPQVLGQPMETSLSRFAVVQKLREQLAAMPTAGADLAAQEQQQHELQRWIDAHMKKLQIADEDDLASALTRFQEHQAAQPSLWALEDAVRIRWPQAVGPDGGLVNELDRRRDELAHLEASLGGWARTVRSGNDIAPLLARWTEAQKLRAEKNGLRSDLVRLMSGPTPEETPVTLPHIDAEDDLLHWIWDQRARFNEALQSLSVERSRVLEQADSSGEKRLEHLLEEVRRLEAETPHHETAADKLEGFKKDRELRATLVALESRAQTIGTVDEINGVLEAMGARLRERRAALGITSDVGLDNVLADFTSYGKLLENKRLLEGLLASQERSVADLCDKLNDLRPRLAGRENATDLDEELASYHRYLAEVERLKGLETDLARLEEEAKALEATVAQTEAAVADVEERLGDWTRDMETDKVLAAYADFVESRDEVQTLRDEIQNGTPLSELESKVTLTEAQLATLGDVMAPPSGLLEQIEEIRKIRLATTQKLQELKALATRLEPVDGAADDAPDIEESTRLIEVQRSTITRLEGEMKAVDAALEKMNTRQDDPPLERCRERASELLARFTRGRYIQMSVDDANQTWLWPAKGGKVKLEDATAVRGSATLCWRLAVMNELGSDYPWPIVVDQPFSEVESSGRFQALEALTDLARDRQVVVLTAPAPVVSQHLVVANLASMAAPV